MLEQIKDLLDKREAAAVIRDAAQKEINELWGKIQSTIIPAFIDAGIFNATWQLQIDEFAHSFKNEYLFLNQDNIVIFNKIKEIHNLSKSNQFSFKYGALLTIDAYTASIRFDRYQSNSAAFIKEYGVKVGFNQLNEKIDILNTRRKIFLGE